LAVQRGQHCTKQVRVWCQSDVAKQVSVCQHVHLCIRVPTHQHPFTLRRSTKPKQDQAQGCRQKTDFLFWHFGATLLLLAERGRTAACPHVPFCRQKTPESPVANPTCNVKVVRMRGDCWSSWETGVLIQKDAGQGSPSIHCRLQGRAHQCQVEHIFFESETCGHFKSGSNPFLTLQSRSNQRDGYGQREHWSRPSSS